MDLHQLSLDDAALIEQTVALENAAIALDSPWVHPSTVHQFQGRMRFGWDLEPPTYVVGLRDDRVVALGFYATSEWDNLDLAWTGATIHPEFRRQGLGSAMYEHLVKRAGDDGRPKVGSDAWDGTAGEAFAKRHGLSPASKAINRRQHLAEVESGLVQRLYEQAVAVAGEYELVRVFGRTPDELMPAVAVMTEAINDAPLDDLNIEDEVFPPERIQNYETATLSKGERLYRLLVRHRETGELAGHTVVAVEGDRPQIGHQHDTSVVRAHRGHRLGLLLKSGMNLWLAEAEPQLVSVDTWNAESNDHMISVNEALGYRWMGRELQFQSHA